MEEIMKKINQFRDDRNWRQYHNAKDFAISISLEAAELLENFQWVSAEEGIKKDPINIEEEIADVLIYTLMLADDLGLDVEEIIEKKIEKNGKKYPIQ
ncbi:MAG: nucleotide pyrophosphohydrolase [Vagococcus sp.]